MDMGEVGSGSEGQRGWLLMAMAVAAGQSRG